MNQKKEKAEFDARENFAKRVFELSKKASKSRTEAKSGVKRFFYIAFDDLENLSHRLKPFQKSEKRKKRINSLFAGIIELLKKESGLMVEKNPSDILLLMKKLHEELDQVAFDSGLFMPTSKEEEVKPSEAPYKSLEE